MQKAILEGGGGGGGCPVIDLSILNVHITLTMFQIETVVLVLGLIRKGDVMFSINLKDVYLKFPFIRILGLTSGSFSTGGSASSRLYS